MKYRQLAIELILITLIVLTYYVSIIADNSTKSKTVEKYYDESENVVCYYVDNAMSCIWSMEKFK